MTQIKENIAVLMKNNLFYFTTKFNKICLNNSNILSLSV